MRSFSSLQSLRGIFALFIFIHHLDLFPAGGDSGVGFFIILSGFVLSAGYRDRIAQGLISRRDFMRRRVRRLFSCHIIGFILALLLMSPFYGWKTPLVWLANILMLQSWIPSPTFYFSCDSPSWCLSDLLFCYLLFPFIILALTRLTVYASTRHVPAELPEEQSEEFDRVMSRYRERMADREDRRHKLRTNLSPFGVRKWRLQGHLGGEGIGSKYLQGKSMIWWTVLAIPVIIYFFVIQFIPESLWTPLIYINPAFRLVDFLLGIMLFYFFTSSRSSQTNGSQTSCSQSDGSQADGSRSNFAFKSLIETLVIGFYVGCILCYPEVSQRYGLASYWWIPSAILIYTFASHDRNGGLWSRLLSTKVLVWFGNLSFAFYMVHYPIIEAFRRLGLFTTPTTDAPLDASSLSIILLIFVITLLLSALVYYKLEPKLASLLPLKTH